MIPTGQHLALLETFLQSIQGLVFQTNNKNKAIFHQHLLSSTTPNNIILWCCRKKYNFFCVIQGHHSRWSFLSGMLFPTILRWWRLNWASLRNIVDISCDVETNLDCARRRRCRRVYICRRVCWRRMVVQKRSSSTCCRWRWGRWSLLLDCQVDASTEWWVIQNIGDKILHWIVISAFHI